VLRDKFVSTQTAEAEVEKRQKLAEAFGKLMEGVNESLLPKNREKFTLNATVFKNEVKNLMLM